ncbi:MAG: type IV pilus assembly protein PilM [Planctomycetota bacterium]
MASSVRGVWAIDIGSSALKALQMREGDVGLEVVDFAYMEHSVNLLSGDVGLAEKEQVVSETLRRFLDEKDLTKTEVAISIAGQNSFTRFINLPPVEAKKVPEVVQFEAVQQIPFDINEVEWDWQLMETEDSPDKRVGLFAIKNELISEVMDHFTKENLRVSCVQISPMALYNYVTYDLKALQQSDRNAVVILDIGAENTTLVVCTKETVWQRSIRIGGNTFTEAIADAFKKNYRTAEKLKRTAPMSKYMRQIYTAMKSVYTDLGSEIQRSLGFYSSSPEGRDKKLTKVIALGGGMKLQGLAKYLTQTLGLPVVKPDSFENLTLSEEISTAKFHENVSDFGIVYGLGVQLLEEAKISTNLLPRKIARAMMWTRKARVFTIAASVLLLVMVLGLGKAYKDLRQHKGHQETRGEISGMINDVKDVSSKISEQKDRREPLEAEIQKQIDCFKYRDTVPVFIETLAQCLPSREYYPDQSALWDAFDSGNVEGVLAVPREERKQLFVTRFAMEFTRDIENADFPKPDTGRTGYQQKYKKKKPGMDPMMDPMFMDEMGMMDGFGGAMPPGGGMAAAKAGDSEKPVEDTGFTVLIEGYSPYRSIAELLDPHGVRDDQSRWGFITRIEKLAVLFPGIPFELFGKHDIKHFVVASDLVDLDDQDMPAGIGVPKVVERVSKESTKKKSGAAGGMTGIYGGHAAQSNIVYEEDVLLDPMTNEEISRIFDIVTQSDIDSDPELDKKDLGRKKYDDLDSDKELYIDRDHWFRIKAKFVWKGAPKPKEDSAAGAGGMMGMY